MKKKNRTSLLILAFFGTILVAKVISVRYIQNSMNNPEIVSDGNIVSSGENFKVFDISQDMHPEYLYEIYDNSGEVVKSETMFAFPTITYVSDTLLSIEWGGGSDTWLGQYYDIDKNICSNIIQSPFALLEQKIVYLALSDDVTGHKMVVSDVFDETKYYKELHIDDLSSAINPILSVEFINNQELKVCYLSGEDYEEKTQVFQID